MAAIDRPFLDELIRFVADGKVVIGICNGFQLLVKTGLLPAVAGQYGEQTVTPMRDESSGEITHYVSVVKDMTERMKLRLMEKEERQIRADLRDAEDDSIEQVRLKTELLEKQKEIADQAEKVQKQQRDWDKEKLEAQEKLNKAKEHEREVLYGINEAESKRWRDEQDLRNAKTDRSRFTMEDLANTGIDRATTFDQRRQIFTARQIRFAEQYARVLAAHGYEKQSVDLFNRADQVRSGLTSLTQNERFPFKQMEKAFIDSEEHLRELIRKASAEKSEAKRS